MTIAKKETLANKVKREILNHKKEDARRRKESAAAAKMAADENRRQAEAWANANLAINMQNIEASALANAKCGLKSTTKSIVFMTDSAGPFYLRDNRQYWNWRKVLGRKIANALAKQGMTSKFAEAKSKYDTEYQITTSPQDSSH